MKYSFILVRPKVPENIGASARALKTMGFDSLVLVGPCGDPEGKAKWLAHGSQDILDNARIYSTLEEVAGDYDLLIATTARKRSIHKQLIKVRELRSFIESKGSTVSRVALVFGNEESGLSNSELACCHISSVIPLATEFPSLNLSQAVMVYAFELSGLSGKNKKKIYEKETDTNSFRLINEKVKDLLKETGLSENPALSGKIRERLAYASEKDLNLLHTVTGTILDIIKRNKVQ